MFDAINDVIKVHGARLIRCFFNIRWIGTLTHLFTTTANGLSDCYPTRGPYMTLHVLASEL